MTSQGAPNRLIHETSPYLLQHAHNPVDWQPWGETAFEEARQRQVPILLSIGYSTCYWCHVMERQCFEDPQIAEQMNEQFVCIKLDREERPDIDDLYMMATQLLTGQGGWPMNCFLTPPPVSTEANSGNSQQTQANSDKSDVVDASQTDTAWSNIGPRGLQPFYAGTYFPPTPMHGRPSWPQLLQGITDAWHNRRQEIMQQAQSVTEAIAHERRQIKVNTPVALTDGPLREAAQQLLSMHDRQHGGFSSAPKFPTPCQLAFIQSLRDQKKAPALGDALALTLDRMARGGIFDQVGGGFHRYSVDGHWLVPHFEKMLYDNAQLLSIYAKAHQQCASQQPNVAQEHARVMRETVAFVERDMTDPSGAFWSALDAEVDTFEGATYVWQIEDVESALTENGADDAGLFAFAKKMYGLAGGPNFQDPHHPKAPASSVLFLPQPLDQLGAWDEVVAKRQTINERLLKARQARKQPSTDKKVIASWNGMMIKGLADAAIALNEPTFADLAAKAANGLQALLVQGDGSWCRTACGGKAQGRMLLEDHAWLALGLLALAKAVKQPDEKHDEENDDNNAGEDLATHWQQQALGHLEMAMAQFDAQGQVPGFYDAPADATDLILRTQSNHDGATPSANAVMLEAMLEAARQAEDAITAQVWRSRALQMLEGFYPTLERQGIAMTAMLNGLSQALNNPAPDPTRPVQIVTVGRSSTPEQAVHVELVLKVQEGFHLYATNAHTPASPTEAADTDDDLLGATEHPTHTAGINVEATDAHGQLLPVSFTPPTPNDHLIGPDGEAIGIYKSSLRISLDIACLDTEDDMDLWLSYQPCTLEACHPSNRLRIPLPARGENG